MYNEAKSWENNLHKPLPSSVREMRMIAFMRSGHSRFKFLLNAPRPKFFSIWTSTFNNLKINVEIFYGFDELSFLCNFFFMRPEANTKARLIKSYDNHLFPRKFT